jgi:hypothetical protein
MIPHGHGRLERGRPQAAGYNRSAVLSPLPFTPVACSLQPVACSLFLRTSLSARTARSAAAPGR